MSNLLLYTVAMMGLTFIIGFFVAGVIKVIANWADFIDFYRLNHQELINLKNEQKASLQAAVLSAPAIPTNKLHNDKHSELTRRINATINSLKPHRRIVA